MSFTLLPEVLVTDRLHLDLSSGARGEMIAAALAAVGAPLRAAEDALLAAGVRGAALRHEETRRGGLRAVRLRIVVDGVELGAEAPVDEDPWAGRHVRSPHERIHRRALPRPRMHGAARAPLVEAASAASVEGGAPATAPSSGEGRVGEPKRRSGRPRASGRFASWLEGAAAGAQELVDELKQSALSPVSKALALKAARRAADALEEVVGPDAVLDGAHAARLYADLVLCASLLEALAPAGVSASPVAVSRGAGDNEGVVGAAGWPAPSPWLLEVLAGVPVIERDDPVSPTDVGGAAFAWALVPRFGARGIAASTRQGLGASAVELRDAAGGRPGRGRAVVARALLGPAPAIPTRAGERHGAPLFAVEALLPAIDRRALVELAAELTAAGGRAASASDEVLLDGSSAGRVRARLLASPDSVDALVSILWRAGAVDVVTEWVELRSAAAMDVTVPVGSGRTRASVRVRVVKDGDEVVHVEPDLDDVRAAAKKGRASTHAVAAEAVAAWERLGGLPARAKGRGGVPESGRQRRRKGGDDDEG